MYKPKAIKADEACEKIFRKMEKDYPHFIDLFTLLSNRKIAILTNYMKYLGIDTVILIWPSSCSIIHSRAPIQIWGKSKMHCLTVSTIGRSLWSEMSEKAKPDPSTKKYAECL
jgi:hypothetical protein